VKQPS